MIHTLVHSACHVNIYHCIGSEGPSVEPLAMDIARLLTTIYAKRVSRIQLSHGYMQCTVGQRLYSSSRRAANIYDVVVVGGGPAGLSLVTALRRSSYRSVESVV